MVSLRRVERSRLPPATRDVPRYDLVVQVAPERGNFLVNQTVEYTHKGDQALPSLVFRLFANVTRPSAMKLVKGDCAGVACEVRWDGSSVVDVVFERPLQPGEQVVVRMRLFGVLRTIPVEDLTMMAQGMASMKQMIVGSHTGDYGLLSRGDGILSFAHFYAVLAHRREGQWVRREGSTLGDLGTDALAHVTLHMRAPPSYRVYPSGVITGRRRVRASHGGSPLRETTAVCALARDFSVLVSKRMATAKAKVGGVVVRSHFLVGHERAGRRVLKVATHALRTFQRRFGAYPYVDLDVVEAPLVGGAGGVEFSALVTVASMFYRGQSKGAGEDGLGGLLAMGRKMGLSGMLSDSSERMLEFVTAHEVAHQYWHGLVGSDSRTHPFVDESLAQFSALLYLSERYGPKRASADRELQVAMSYRMMRMLGIPDAPVRQPVANFVSGSQYAGLVYGKGALMYVKLRRAVGDRAFFSALRKYVQRYRFGTAPPSGPLSMFQAPATKRKVAALARHWLDETHGDEDIGELDLGALLDGGGGSLPGPGGSGGSSPDVSDMSRMLKKLLPAP